MTSTLQTTAIPSPRAIQTHSGGPGAAFVRTLKKIPAWLTIAFLVIVTAYPLFWMFINSLKSNSDFLNNPSYAFPEVWQWSNYPEAWVTGNLATTISNSIIVTIPSLFLIVILGTAAGFALEILVFKGRAGILLLFLAGIMIPGQMIVLPLFTAFFQIGITGSYLPMILIYTASGLPLTVFMMATTSGRSPARSSRRPRSTRLDDPRVLLDRPADDAQRRSDGRDRAVLPDLERPAHRADLRRQEEPQHDPGRAAELLGRVRRDQLRPAVSPRSASPRAAS